MCMLCLASAQQKTSASLMNAPIRVVNITRKDKEYRGMLEYREGDEIRLLKNVVTGMYWSWFSGFRITYKCFTYR